VCVLLCFCTVHSIVCLMFMMWLPYGVINYNNNKIYHITRFMCAPYRVVRTGPVCCEPHRLHFFQLFSVCS